MSPPSPQHYLSKGRRHGINETVLLHAVAAIERIHRADARLTPVLTLRHLSALSGVPYGYLRRVIGRKLGGYRHFLLRKRMPGRSRHRLISIPPNTLMEIQQWIVQNILRYARPSKASFAYHPQSRSVYAAEEHVCCEWLLKIDIEDFFHNITEGKVSGVFYRLGYPRLLAFELARICTMPIETLHQRRDAAQRWPSIPSYQYPHEGVLPQGAPTSSMLSNLVMKDLDDRLIVLAARYGMRYTRYADDLAFSCVKGRNRAHVERFKKLVLLEISREGFRHNLRKTVIRGPGTRRIVLGMLVDGPIPRLSREFKDMLRLHLHYLRSPAFGPSKHAESRRTSVSSLYYHVRGLIAWAETVEPKYGTKILAEFREIRWPTVQPR